MMLIADFGDNKAQYDTHTLYIVAEPESGSGRFVESFTVGVSWRIVFSYPDGPHDAEGVAVDTADEKVLILTKRDRPPLVFAVPLAENAADGPVVAVHVSPLQGIPAPSAADLLQKFGPYRSQPTALDISPDGRRVVVLTYKHAYLFRRGIRETWADAFGRPPETITLPLPEETTDLIQREAVCFTHDGNAVLLTSERKEAGIYRVDLR